MTPPPDKEDQPARIVSHETSIPSKRKRSSRACDRCHRESRKCSFSSSTSSCTRCNEQEIACTYDRPVKRRGPAPRKNETLSEHGGRRTRSQAQASPPNRTQPMQHVDAAATPTSTPSIHNLPTPHEDISHLSIALQNDGPTYLSATRHRSDVNVDANVRGDSSAPVPQYEDVIPPDILEKLVEIYYHTAYPLRPYFHWPTYQAQVQLRQYRYDWGLFTFTMAVCAMAAGRLCDGVLMPTGPNPLRLQAAGLFNRCYAAAVGAIPDDITSVTDYYHAMKAKAILASASLQNGEWQKAVAHLGDYASLSAVSGFCDETNWPRGLTEIQMQEKRRVFWGVYQQEQYLSSNFGFASRQREVKAMVKYPVEVFDDDDITETGIQLWSEHVSFIKGFNFCTDLYRVLERIEGTVRARQLAASREPGGRIEAFLAEIYPSKRSASDSLHLVSQLYEDLPDELKKPKTLTGDLRADRYGFIACNVLLTTQTLRMLLVGTGKPNIHHRCAVASELLDELSTIPIAFFHASSTVSLHHMAHIGHMLGGDIQDAPPMWSYLQVRNILTVLADFLDKIESDRMIAIGLASKLRDQIDRIDHHMRQASSKEQDTGLVSMGTSLQPNLHSSATSYSPEQMNSSKPHMYSQVNMATTFGTNIQTQSLIHEKTPNILQSNLLDGTRAEEAIPTTSTSTVPNSTRQIDPYGLNQNHDMFQLPLQPQFDASRTTPVDTLFSSDLFTNWPYSIN